MPEDSTVTLLLQNAAGQVLADSAGFLRLRWGAQPRSLTDTRAMFTTAAQALARYGWHCMLINQVDMLPFTPQEQQWISTDWLPEAVRTSGYRFGAVVVATDVRTRLATSYVTTSASALPLRYRSFDSEAAAANWLLTQLG